MSRKCDCCGKDYDERAARVVAESFSCKSTNHYVCPQCFSKIEELNSKGLEEWFLVKWWHRPPSVVFFMDFEYKKSAKVVVK